jgi:hypothetical protein
MAPITAICGGLASLVYIIKLLVNKLQKTPEQGHAEIDANIKKEQDQIDKGGRPKWDN